MQGIGVAAGIAAYAVFYALGKQILGPGGSILYWATGNPAFGAPPGHPFTVPKPTNPNTLKHRPGFSGGGPATGAGGGGAF